MKIPEKIKHAGALFKFTDAAALTLLDGMRLAVPIPQAQPPGRTNSSKWGQSTS